MPPPPLPNKHQQGVDYATPVTPAARRSSSVLWVLGIALAAAIFITLVLVPARKRPSSQPPSTVVLSNGNVAKLASGGVTCYLAVDDSSRSELGDAIRRNDPLAVKNLILAGKVFVAANGTRVTVIDSGLFTTTVRVQEGPAASRAGIVPNEWLQK